MSRTEPTRGALSRPPQPAGPRPTPRSDDAAEPAVRAARRALATEPGTASPGPGPGAPSRRPLDLGHPDAEPPERRRTLLAIQPRPVYLPALDGLRALSVAAVVAFHLGRLGGGFIGVDVFFVISGFLITRLLLAERERRGHIDLAAFWGRRFRRLLPALFVVLAAVTVASRFWMESWRLDDLRADALATLAYVANWRFVSSGQSYFAEGVVPSPLRHAWSLAIEEQFYVLWPLVVMLVLSRVHKRYRLVLMIVSGVGALASATWMAVAAGLGVDLTRLYYGTDTRAFALLAGAWLAAWWDPVVADAPRPLDRVERPRPLTRAAGVALLPLAVLAVVAAEDTSWFYRVGFQSVAVLATIAVAGLATGEGPVSRMMGHPVLCWLGRRSYGIYLWSWPVQIFASSHFGLTGLRLDVVVVTITLGLATLSFQYVEEPVRRMWRSGRRARVSVPATAVPMTVRFGAAVVVVVAIIYVSTSGGTPAPIYMEVSDAEAAASALDEGTGFSDPQPGAAENRITTTQPSAVTAPPPATGPTTTLPIPPGPVGPFAPDAPALVPRAAAVDPYDIHGRPLRVMIAGDSVGWSLGWKPSSDITGSIQMEDRAIIGCGVMPPESSWSVAGVGTERYSDFCLEQDRAEGIGLDAGPDVVLLWLGAWEVYDHEIDGEPLEVFSDEYAAVIEQRLQQRVDRYRAAGVPTVMPMVPCFGTVAPRLGTERYDERRRDWVNDRLMAVAARNRTWVRVIDPFDMLCDDNGVAIENTPDGVEIRADGAHFDPHSAAWFWNNWLAGQLGAAFLPPKVQ